MGRQPYSSLHFIYIPGCINQSDWEQSPRLRRGIKRQKCLRCSHPSLIIPPLFLLSPPHPERSRYCPKCHSRSDTSAPCALPIDLASGRPEKGALAAGPISSTSSCWGSGGRDGGPRRRVEGMDTQYVKLAIMCVPHYWLEKMKLSSVEDRSLFGQKSMLF